MAGTGVQKLSHTHEAVMDWLVLNPDRSLRECADHFGYTQPWLSTLIHSDIFQAKLAERRLEVNARIAASIPEKLTAVADIALDKLAEKVSASEDPDFILDAADRALHRMGFAPASARNPGGSPGLPGPGPGAVQNNFFITGNDLAQARQIMQAAGQQIPLTIDAEVVVEPAPAAK